MKVDSEVQSKSDMFMYQLNACLHELGYDSVIRHDEIEIVHDLGEDIIPYHSVEVDGCLITVWTGFLWNHTYYISSSNGNRLKIDVVCDILRASDMISKKFGYDTEIGVHFQRTERQ